MESKLIWANLVSGDLEKTNKFYTELGFKPYGKYKVDEGTSFFLGPNNFVINFFARQRLEKDVNGNLSIPKGKNEVIFSLAAESKDVVDSWVEKVTSAGGTIFSEPQDYEAGYTFGFADSDGHKFNVLYLPGMLKHAVNAAT